MIVLQPPQDPPGILCPCAGRMVLKALLVNHRRHPIFLDVVDGRKHLRVLVTQLRTPIHQVDPILPHIILLCVDQRVAGKGWGDAGQYGFVLALVVGPVHGTVDLSHGCTVNAHVAYLLFSQVLWRLVSRGDSWSLCRLAFLPLLADTLG